MKLRINSLLLESFATLSARERRLVMAGALLAALIVVFGILVPLDRSVAHAQERLVKKHADLSWMQSVAPELAATAPPPTASGESLLVIIDRSARESGLAGALSAASRAGPGACRCGSSEHRSIRWSAGWPASPSRMASSWSPPPSREPAHRAW